MKKLFLGVVTLLLPWVVMADESAQLRFIATSDLHGFMKGYDYYKQEKESKYGLENLLGEIDFYRKEVPNTFLIDLGDTLVGSPLGDFYADSYTKQTIDLLREESPIICSLNNLQYDVATLGNHEFDYGIPFLEHSYDKANFSIVTSNIKKANGEPFYLPYTILEREIVAGDGSKDIIKVGFVSITPPQTMDLNASKINGLVYFEDQLNNAINNIKSVQQAGADIVVVLSHSGMSGSEEIEYKNNMENIVSFLSKEEAIDAILFGHTHKIFSNGKSVDRENNIPAMAQPGKWGEALAIIDLNLVKKSGKWEVIRSNSYTVKNDVISETDSLKTNFNTCVATLESALIEDLETPVTQLVNSINNWLNLLGNDPLYELLNQSQVDYLLESGVLESNTVPILSSVAPAVSFNDPNYFIDIEAGDVTKRQILPSIYPATLSALEVTGKEVKEWLEISSSIYATQLDDNNNLLIPNAMTFLYYPIYGVTYDIDLSQESLYNQFGHLVSAGAGRIQNLKYKGKVVDEDDQFILIASSYAPYFAKEKQKNRAFLDIGAPNNKELLIGFLKKHQPLELIVEQNWQLKIPTGRAAHLKLSKIPQKNIINELPHFDIDYNKTLNELTVFSKSIEQ